MINYIHADEPTSALVGEGALLKLVFELYGGLLFVVDQFALFELGGILDTDGGVFVDLGLEEFDGYSLYGRFGLVGQYAQTLLLPRLRLARVDDALFDLTEVAFFQFFDQRFGLQAG